MTGGSRDLRRRGAGSFRALAIGAIGALLVTGGVVLAVWPSGASAPLASVASEPSVPDAVAQVSASDDPKLRERQIAAFLRAGHSMTIARRILAVPPGDEAALAVLDDEAMLD